MLDFTMRVQLYSVRYQLLSMFRYEKEGCAMDTIQAKTRPLYETPKVTIMDRDEVLQAFQMTAAEISAAGCWWSNACGSPNPS